MTNRPARQPTSRAGVHGGRIGPDAEPSREDLLAALASYVNRDRPLDAAEARALLDAAVATVQPLDGASAVNPTTAERVALHEAGHTTVGRALAAAGRGPAPTLAAVQTAWSGSTHYGEGYTDRASAVTRLLAGPVAERLAFGRDLGGGDDLRCAAALLAGAPAPARLVREAAASAETTLRLCWGEVERIAAGLRRAGTLQAHHIDALAETAPVRLRLDGLDRAATARLLAASGDGEAALAVLQRVARARG